RSEYRRVVRNCAWRCWSRGSSASFWRSRGRNGATRGRRPGSAGSISLSQSTHPKDCWRRTLRQNALGCVDCDNDIEPALPGLLPRVAPLRPRERQNEADDPRDQQRHAQFLTTRRYSDLQRCQQSRGDELCDQFLPLAPRPTEEQRERQHDQEQQPESAGFSETEVHGSLLQTVLPRIVSSSSTNIPGSTVHGNSSV